MKLFIYLQDKLPGRVSLVGSPGWPLTFYSPASLNRCQGVDAYDAR